MRSIIVRLLFLGAAAQLGAASLTLKHCRASGGLLCVEKAGRETLRIKWRAIEVFPQEARRFR